MSARRAWQAVACLSLSVNVLFLAYWSSEHILRGRPRILSVAYEPGESEGDRGAFTVRFATPMDTDSALPGELPVVFTPPVEGKVLWKDTRTAVVVPATPVQADQNYRVTPRPGLCDQEGRPLSARPAALRTAPLRLERIDGLVQETPERLRLRLHFSVPVHPDALVRYLTLTAKDRAPIEVRCPARQPAASLEITFEPPPGAESFRLRVRAGMPSADGASSLAKDVTAERRRQGSLCISSLTSRSAWDGITLELRFNADVAAASAREFISVTPPVEDLSVEPAEWHWDACLYLCGAFQPRTYYRVTLRKGLPSKDGSLRLERDTALGTVTDNLVPLLELNDDRDLALVLPARRARLLPAQFRNVERADFRAYRVYPNNLVAWSTDLDPYWGWSILRRGSLYGHFVGKVSITPGLPENVKGTLNIPLDPLLKGYPYGLFCLTLQGPGGSDSELNTRALLVTDIGLGAAWLPGSLGAWALSLADGAPLAGVDIEVLSAKNQTLARGVTGPEGTVRLNIAPGPSEEMDPCVVVARLGDDMAYVRVDPGSARDLTPFSIAGRELPQHPYEAMVNTDRGVARPGESVVAEVILRDASFDAADGVPVEIRLVDPEDNVLLRTQAPTSPHGLLVRTVQVPPPARLGRYRVQAGLPGDPETVWGAADLLVAEYRPDRLRCTASLDRDRYRPGSSLTARLNARYYFGTPAAASRVRFRVCLAPAPFAPPGYDGFVFGDENRETRGLDEDRVAVAETDAEGAASATLELPAGVEAPAALRLTLAAGVTVPGGETVSASATAWCDPVPYYLGIRLAANSPEPVPTGGDRRAFDWVAVNPDGSPHPAPEDLAWELLEIRWEHVLRENEEGRYVRDWERQLHRISSGAVRVPGAEGKGRFTVSCPGPGLYALRLAAGAGRIQSCIQFWHEAGGGNVARLADPSVLVLETDRPACRPGEEVEVRFRSPSAGQAVVAVMTSRVESVAVRPVQAGPNALRVQIPRTPLGTCLLAVTAVTPPEGTAEVPGRSFGMAALTVLHDDRRLRVDLDAPALVRPGTRFPVTLRLSTGGAPQEGTVHLMAVDEGVLALTAHPTPDPFAYFLGPRRPRPRVADLYGDVSADTAGRYATVSAVGGDGMGAFLLSVRPEDLRQAVAVSREVEVGAGGQAEVTLDVPAEYAGELRLMAVAVNRRGLGSAQRPVTVRSPLTILPSAPRAVAPGDTFQISAVLHAEPGISRVEMALSLEGPARVVSPGAAQTAVLDAGGTAALSWTCQAATAEAGRVSLTLQAAGDGHSRTAAEFLHVRPAALPVYRSGFERVLPGSSFFLAAGRGLLPGTVTVGGQVSATSRVETAGALAWLLQYPYGCLEQTLSRTVPCVAMPDQFPSPDATGPVADALRTLATCELPSGGFSMWSGDDLWVGGSLYAAHFLMEAERAGFPVEPSLRNRTVAFLRRVAVSGDGSLGVGDRAYALYLAASMGKPDLGLARGMAASAEHPPLVRLLAGAALVRSGRPAEGMPAVEKALGQNLLEGSLGWDDLDSDVRRAALALCVLNDIAPDNPAADRIADLVRRRRGPAGHWGTTQDNALAVLALARRRQEPVPGVALVTLGQGSEPRRVAGADVLTLTHADVAAGVTVAAQQGPVFVAWHERGIPAEVPADEVRQGIAVKRQYLTLEGKPVRRLRHGDLILVRLVLESPVARRNVVVADLLPGGLEIEDPSLATRASRPERPEEGALEPKAVQLREDRLVLCADMCGDAPHTRQFSYLARAVTRGDFAIPRVRAEAMYDPAVAGESGGAGRLVIE